MAKKLRSVLCPLIKFSEIGEQIVGKVVCKGVKTIRGEEIPYMDIELQDGTVGCLLCGSIGLRTIYGYENVVVGCHIVIQYDGVENRVNQYSIDVQ